MISQHRKDVLFVTRNPVVHLRLCVVRDDIINCKRGGNKWTHFLNEYKNILFFKSRQLHLSPNFYRTSPNRSYSLPCYRTEIEKLEMFKNERRHVEPINDD